MTSIYRGYDIKEGSTVHPIQVWKDGVCIYTTKTESDAYDFIDESKRELAQAKAK